MRLSARRLLVLLNAIAVLALAAAPANAAQVVGGTLRPSALTGRTTVVVFFHPF